MIRVLKAILATCLFLLVTPGAAPWLSAAPGSVVETNDTVRVIPATDALMEAATAEGGTIRDLIEAIKPTIGVRYEWGGSDLKAGVDCSNYTWQLFRKAGLRYDRYLDTRALSQVQEAHGLHKISFEEAKAGDLLVYGYWDETDVWRGHVVILVDKDGQATGHKGLVLGAHGPPVDQVQFITFTGFDEGYYKTPQKRLCNVLRVEASN